MARNGRLAREIKMIPKRRKPGVFLGPVGDSMDDFEASITGEEGTPYESGVFKLEIKVPDKYPFTPPVLRFVTQVYHPNIDNAGRICLKSLKAAPAGDWTPHLTLIDVVNEVRMLLGRPNPNDSLMPEIAQQYITDREKFNEMARKLTEKHACQDRNAPNEDEKTEIDTSEQDLKSSCDAKL